MILKFSEKEKAEAEESVRYEALQQIKKGEGKGSCLLGSCKILLPDFSTKNIEDIVAVDEIMDAQMNQVTVIAANTSFLGDRELYQLNDNGPIFTPEHQFLNNLEPSHIGVVSKTALFRENPQFEEQNVSQLNELDTLMQLKGNNMAREKFELKAFKREDLDPSTKVHFIITDSVDGTYIADGFASRHELPNFYAWPLTYTTFGLILVDSKITFPIDTMESDTILALMIQDLIKQWEHAIFIFRENKKEEDLELLNGGHPSFSGVNFEDILAKKSNLINEFSRSATKMRAAQYMNMFGAKILHDFLDDDKEPRAKRISAMKIIVNLSITFFENLSL